MLQIKKLEKKLENLCFTMVYLLCMCLQQTRHIYDVELYGCVKFDADYQTTSFFLVRQTCKGLLGLDGGLRSTELHSSSHRFLFWVSGV